MLALHPKNDVDRLLFTMKNWRLWITANTVDSRGGKRRLNDYISTSREKLLKAVKMENILKTTETKAQYKKQIFENKLKRWKNKPLHGQHLRNTDGKQITI